MQNTEARLLVGSHDHQHINTLLVGFALTARLLLGQVQGQDIRPSAVQEQVISETDYIIPDIPSRSLWFEFVLQVPKISEAQSAVSWSRAAIFCGIALLSR